MTPQISICIPAYKHVIYLTKLLHSISIQKYKDFEVVITDDSPDDDVKQLLEKFEKIIDIRYYKNKNVLGTPENWNEAIRKANGKWIKLMHDDDWLANENSLQSLYDATVTHPDCSFFFSAYNNVEEKSGYVKSVYLSPMGHFLLRTDSLNLFKKQYIGNPSCTLIKRDLNILYDSSFKWVVDFEYYIRCLKKAGDYFYINSVLINVGINDEQVTKYTFRKPEVEIPENHLLLKKLGSGILTNIFVYDYYWRMYRNLKIRDVSEIEKYSDVEMPKPLVNLISFQAKIPQKLLFTGVFSKMFMLISYLRFKKK